MVTLHEFILTADRVVAFETRFQQKQQTATTPPFFKNRLQLLWEETESAFHDFMSSEHDDSEAVRAEIIAVEEKYHVVFETYVRYMARMIDLLETLQGPSAPVAVTIGPENLQTPAGPPKLPQPSSAVFNPRSPLFSDNALTPSTIRHDDDTHGFRVPPCTIKDFHRDHGSWPTFRDLFTAMFINNSRVSEVEQLFHLIHHTKGDAHDIVAKVPLTNAGFNTAWQCLIATYENKRLLMTEQMTILNNLPIVKEESETSIKQLQRGINNCLAIITQHDLAIVNWDPFLVFLCCQRLPKKTVDLWEQRVCNKKEVTTWVELDAFLTERAITLKSIATTREVSLSIPKLKSTTNSAPCSSKTHHTQVDTRKPRTPTASQNISSKICQLCNTPKHHVRYCKVFRNLSVPERWNKIKDLSLCFNCLKNDHSVSKCASTFNCATCQQRHHTLLHDSKPQPGLVPIGHQWSSKNSKPVVQASPFQPATQVLTTTTSSSDATTSHNQVSPQYQLFHQQLTELAPMLPATKGVILGTANLLLHHNGITFPIRALIDSGSEVTCISKSVRTRLRLPVRTTNISLLGVNSQVTAQASQICPIQIGPTHDLTITYEVAALVLQRISGSLPSVDINIQHHQLPNLPLADHNFFKKAPIDLLIGADLFASIILPGIHRNILGSLLAQETVFGWILTGKFSASRGHSLAASHIGSSVEINTKFDVF